MSQVLSDVPTFTFDAFRNHDFRPEELGCKNGRLIQAPFSFKHETSLALRLERRQDGPRDICRLVVVSLDPPGSNEPCTIAEIKAVSSGNRYELEGFEYPISQEAETSFARMILRLARRVASSITSEQPLSSTPEVPGLVYQFLKAA